MENKRKTKTPETRITLEKKSILEVKKRNIITRLQRIKLECKGMYFSDA